MGKLENLKTLKAPRLSELNILRGRRVVLGVSGGIAAYKAVDLCRRLVDSGAHVIPVLTADAERFIGAVTFSALASEKAKTSLFDDADPIPHTHLGQSADVVVVAPATAKLLGKYSHGISDDLLSATLLATTAPVVVAPAMHTEMWQHPAVIENVETLARRGVRIVAPGSGRLAGGDIGEGRLAEIDDIVTAICLALAVGKDLAGVNILVTAGGTREAIDPVRFVGNRSSGKMGHAIADAAARRGAAVTLVTTSEIPVDPSVHRVSVESAEEMSTAVLAHFGDADVVCMAAAVADFRPKVVAAQKLKKADGVPEIHLEPTQDIIGLLGTRKDRQILIGFAAETGTGEIGDLQPGALGKLKSKNLDIIVANDVSAAGSGFGTDTNKALILDAAGTCATTSLISKIELAGLILDRAAAMLPQYLINSAQDN